MQIRIPITKVDEARREVWGVAAVEQVDRANEILDYESSKPLFQQWSDDVSKATGGKSLGNVRAMHNKQHVAAGKLIAFLPNDTEKQFEIGTKIVDDNEWLKVCEGVYSGFSIGGDYERRWDDPVVKGVKRYTAKPIEVSLVDTPCIPGALFEAIKADGSREMRKFAVSRILSAPPALSPAELDRLAKALDAHATAKTAKAAEADALLKKLALRKGMWDVGTLAQIMLQISCMEDSLTYEADYEGDASKIPAQLRAALVTLKQIFLDLAAEEVTELVGETPEAAAKAAAAELNKEVGSMLTQLQKAIALAGASADPEMKKMEAHLTEIGKHVDKIAKAHEDMRSHIEALQGEENDDKKNDGVKPRPKPKGEDEEAEKAAAAGSLAKSVSDSRLDKIEASIQKSNEVLGLLAKRLVDTPVASVAIQKAADVPADKDKPAAITDPNEAIKAMHAAGMTRRLA